MFPLRTDRGYQLAAAVLLVLTGGLVAAFVATGIEQLAWAIRGFGVVTLVMVAVAIADDARRKRAEQSA